MVGLPLEKLLSLARGSSPQQKGDASRTPQRSEEVRSLSGVRIMILCIPRRP